MKKSIFCLSLLSVSSLITLSSAIWTSPVSAGCWYEGPSWARIRVCNYEGPEGTVVEDIQQELDNCFNGGGCSLPADEVWGEGGRIAYTSGAASIATKNARLPAQELDSFQKRRLRPHFGDLVDRVRIKYGATTLDNWRVGNTRISVPSGGQTFCNNIYITRRYRSNDFDLLELIAHEMVHSQQCERLGGLSNFGYHYFKEYKRANQNYRNNRYEREAYDFIASIDLQAEPTAGRHVDWTRNLGDRITSHREMPEGSYLQSGDGRFKMVVQGDGNLVIYQSGVGAIWASNTDGRGSPGFKLAMQSDGNLVMYGSNGATWASNTNGVGQGPYTLVMQNDGNLVVYDRNGATWASGTCCR